MGFLDYFRRPSPIGDLDGLADFIDRQAAFLVQKGIYEFARARAGHYAKVLFADPGFHEAAEIARWRAFPLGLAMVAEIVEGILRPYSGERRVDEISALSEVVLQVFDLYPVPGAVGEASWSEARTELARRLQLIGLHPPKRAMDVPATFAEAYFELMPIHEKLRKADAPTLHNYLKVTLCNIHDEFSKRADAPMLAAALY
jgi:hypothetical protein